MADGKSSKGPKRAREHAPTSDAPAIDVESPTAEPGLEASAPAESPRPLAALAESGSVAMAASPGIAEDGASLEADRVDVHMSAIGRVESSELSVNRGAVGAARTDNLTVTQGAVGAVLADRVEVDRGYARSILSRQVQLDRSAARIVIAADVNAHQSAVMFLVARRVAGEVRVLFDWRGALAFGAAAGFVIALLSRRRRGR
jgi:hypothetical protein